ncbi:Uncharacterized protein APZ42_000559 [Daphnia magna]|uniref:Uncharacterized protein n=1 Tax=Daphnia magna TaxID=35525 RepID=A0A164JJJ9_9CRUS|nr:Uncharacterized protein APZ42_000559 [Daphnia magna]
MPLLATIQRLQNTTLQRRPNTTPPLMRLPAITLRLQSTTLPQATTLKQLQNTIRGQVFLKS